MTIKLQIIIASTLAAFFGALAGLAILFSYYHTVNDLQRTVLSHEQLALAKTIETLTGEAIIERLFAITPDKPADTRASIEVIQQQLNALKDRTQREMYQVPSATEKLAEAQELGNIDTIEAQAKTLFTQLDHTDRTTLPSQDMLIPLGEDYQTLRVLLGDLVDDELMELQAAEESLQKKERLLLITVTFAVAFLIILILVFSLFFYRRISSPLSYLIQQMGSLPENQQASPPTPPMSPEFRQLDISFQDMALKINQQYQLLQENNTLLESTVQARTRELEQKARKLADLDQARRLFFAKVSHELRSPLTVILGESVFGAKSPNDTESRFNKIQAYSQLLDRRIKDLLVIARSDSGTMPLDIKPTEKQTIIKHAKEMSAVFAQSRKIETKWCVSGAYDAELLADSDWLTHAIVAILDNGIKHSPIDGCIYVYDAVNEHEWHLTIRDEGDGVSPEHLASLVEPFFQSDNARPHSGSGLGLSVVHWVVSQHGGTLAIQNHPDGGLEVDVRIPILG